MIWIDKTFLEWEAITETSALTNKAVIQNSYELWNHANEILIRHSSKGFLSDSINNLNRAINFRIKVLNEIYHFNDSPFRDKERKVYNQLEQLEIVRPRLINEINEFRNKIEHHDKTPPPISRCKDYLEICWYFLKATDLYLLNIKESVLFQSHGKGNYWVSVEIEFDKQWRISIGGWYKPTMVSFSERPNMMKINLESKETRQELLKRLPPKERKSFDTSQRGENPDDLYFRGILIAEKSDLRNVVMKYFQSI